MNLIATILIYMSILCDTSIVIADLQPQEPQLVSIGTYTIVHYCTEPYDHICGNGNGITASGTQVTPYQTIAVDPTVIPLGTVVIINDQEYIAEDTGGWIKGYKIDMAVTTHNEALELGRYKTEVFIYGK